jgi:predicted RNA binding protein YcfA (HicA-like mRNA interferase family)
VKSKEVNRRIERLGGTQTRQVGSHRRYAAAYTKPDGTDATVHTTVAQHAGDDIPVGTLKKIEKDLEPAFGKGWLTT